MQRDGHAVTGKRGDDRGLISEVPEAVGFIPHIAIGNRGNGEGARPARFGAAQPAIEVWRTHAKSRKQSGPCLADGVELSPTNDEAEIGETVLDRFKPG